MKKRLFSILLTVCMALTLLPTAALAEGGTVTEQFKLPIGGTYYFDLSSEAGTITYHDSDYVSDKIGTINFGDCDYPAVPDPTLHYVPFTYVGTVNAYSLENIDSGTVTTEKRANALKSDHSLFVADYTISRSISWDALNTAGLIFGKEFDTNYKLRSLSVGSSVVDATNYLYGSPTSNEWDSILRKNSEWIKNCSICSWGQDTQQSDSTSRAMRGSSSAAASWNNAPSVMGARDFGWRPALEVLNPAGGLNAIALNLNGGKLKESETDINIVYAGATFTAPSGEGLTPPTGKVFDKWNTQKDGKGTDYAVGANVPNSVTTLYAQWNLPKAATPAATFAATGADSGTLSGLTAGAPYKYSVDGGLTYADFTGATAEIASGITAAKGIWVVKTGDGTTTSDSKPLKIDITQATAPTVDKTDCTTSTGDDGTITGVDNTMEYRKGSETTYTTITGTGTPVTGLAPDTYHVRVKATGAVLASADTGVTIKTNVTDKITFTDGTAVYNGAAQTHATATMDAGVAGGSFAYTYTTSDGAFESKQPKGVGTYTVTATYESDAAIGSKQATFTITKATITITAEDKSVYVGDALPSYTYTVTGWQGSDSDSTLTTAPTVTCPTANASAAGTYPINAGGANAGGNYDITYVPGTLTVSTRSGGDYFTTMVTEIKSGDSITAENLDWLIFNNKNLTVTGADGAKLVFGTDALRGINDQTSGSVKVEIKDVSKEHQDTQGGKNVFSLTVTSGGKTVSGFAGKVTISLPYTLKDGENAEDVTVWSLAEDGSMTKIPATYDPKTGLATATANYFSKYVVGVWVNPFTDVDSGAYYYDALIWAVGKNITGGTSATTFCPDLPCTRAQAVSFLWRVAGSPAATGNNPFTDVDSGAYYYDAVLWAVGKGITKGTSATTFAPNTICNRGHIAAFLYRYAGSPTVLTGNPFTDVAADAYYYDAVLWAVEKGITSGTSATTFAPNTTCTRGQIVTFLYRHMGK